MDDRLKLTIPAGSGRGTANAPQFPTAHKPPPIQNDEPPLKPVSSLGVEYLAAGVAGTTIIGTERFASLISAGVKLGVGTTAAEIISGFAFSTAFKPFESALISVKEQVLTQPPTSHNIHPILDPTAPFTEIYRRFVLLAASQKDPVRQEVELAIAQEKAEVQAEKFDELRVLAGQIASLPRPSAQSIAALEQIKLALENIGPTPQPPGAPKFRAVIEGIDAAIERQTKQYLQLAEVGAHKGPGHGYTQFDKVEVDP